MSDDMLVNRLMQVQERIAAVVEDRPEAALRQAATPEGWTAADILAHLRASDDIIAYRAYTILVRDNPPLPAYDERRWAAVAYYDDIAVAASLLAFTVKRAELVRMLRRLAPADWERQGTHEISGPRTLRAVITVLVEHEEEHCAQLEGLGLAAFSQEA
jgi:hypothetical protein